MITVQQCADRRAGSPARGRAPAQPRTQPRIHAERGGGEAMGLHDVQGDQRGAGRVRIDSLHLHPAAAAVLATGRTLSVNPRSAQSTEDCEMRFFDLPPGDPRWVEALPVLMELAAPDRGPLRRLACPAPRRTSRPRARRDRHWRVRDTGGLASAVGRAPGQGDRITRRCLRSAPRRVQTGALRDRSAR
jgi:hypothetical protein